MNPRYDFIVGIIDQVLSKSPRSGGTWRNLGFLGWRDMVESIKIQPGEEKTALRDGRVLIVYLQFTEIG